MFYNSLEGAIKRRGYEVKALKEEGGIKCTNLLPLKGTFKEQDDDYYIAVFMIPIHVGQDGKIFLFCFMAFVDILVA